MRYICIFLFLVLSCTELFAGRYVRYNLAGYEPNMSKTIVLMSDDNCIKVKWKIKGKDSSVVLSGELDKSITSAGRHMPKMFNYIIDFTEIKNSGIYRVEIEGFQHFNVTVKEEPYAFLASKVLRYLRQQRSGSEDAIDHGLSHTGDKSCPIHYRKGLKNNEWGPGKTGKTADMLGGWYDAGDYIKFTLTTSYTTYLLLRAYEVYPEMFNQKKYSKTGLIDILDEAKWGLDYLMKTMPDSTEFIIQTGGWLDHEQGYRLPEEDKLNGKRECYSALSPTQMGYTAAALALGANIFRQTGKTKEADKYEAMAKKIFRIAQANDKNEKVAWFEKDFQFYADKSLNDNMQLAATELYILTKDKNYLQHAKTYADKAGAADWAAWSICHMIAHTRLAPYYKTPLGNVEKDLELFSAIAKEDNNIWGVPHKYTWATLYSIFSVANGSMLYKMANKDDKYMFLAENVIDYTLGKNNWGISMIATKDISPSVKNIYSQVYSLQPKLYPAGAIAEGPGDKATHDNLMRHFKISNDDPFKRFDSSEAVFYDNNTDFQCMETTITGLADGIFMLALMSKVYR